MAALQIKRCPFCGGRAVKRMGSDSRYKVTCTRCFCSTPTFDSQNKALLAWNRRHDDGDQ